MAWRQFASSPAYTGARGVTTAAHADRWWWCLDTKIKSDHLCWRSVFEIEWETDLICLLSQRRLGQLSLGSWQQRLWPWMGSGKSGWKVGQAGELTERPTELLLTPTRTVDDADNMSSCSIHRLLPCVGPPTGHSANSQTKLWVHLVALIARPVCVSLWLKSTSFHLLQTGFMPTSHLAVGTCLTPALTNPQQTWSTSLQSDESLTSQTRLEIPPGHEMQRRR